jgi:putative endonuclease
MRTYFVYMLTNRSGTLYVGVTNDLERRMAEHRAAGPSTFTGRYRMNRLVYFEAANDARTAIEREKQLKGWTRARKIALIADMNPRWRDLSEDWVSISEGHTAGLDSSVRSE